MQLEVPSVPPLFHKKQFNWQISKEVVKAIGGVITRYCNLNSYFYSHCTIRQQFPMICMQISTTLHAITPLSNMKTLHYVTYKMETHENQGSGQESLVITQPVIHRLEYCLFRLGTKI